jgi:hypothetical protein
MYTDEFIPPGARLYEELHEERHAGILADARHLLRASRSSDIEAPVQCDEPDRKGYRAAIPAQRRQHAGVRCRDVPPRLPPAQSNATHQDTPIAGLLARSEW